MTVLTAEQEVWLRSDARTKGRHRRDTDFATTVTPTVPVVRTQSFGTRVAIRRIGGTHLTAMINAVCLILEVVLGY